MLHFVRNLFSIDSHFYCTPRAVCASLAPGIPFSFLSASWRQLASCHWQSYEIGALNSWQSINEVKETIYTILVGKRKRLYLPMPHCLKNRETILIECRQTFKNTNEDGVDRELNFKWCFWKHLLSKRVDKVIKVIRNDSYDRYKPFYLFHLYAPIYL